MKKYWFIPTGNKVWLEAAKNIYELKIGRPVLWVGDNKHYKEAKNYFGNAVLSSQDLVFYPERLATVSYKAKSSEFFLSDNYIRAKDRCLKMMDRLDLYGSFSRIDREVVFNKLCIWILNKFEETTPDALILVENPHSHTYYLIYEICLYQNIQIIKFNRWLNIPVMYAQNLTTGKRQKVSIKMQEDLSLKFDSHIKEFINDLSRLNNNDNYILPAIKIQINGVKLKNKIINFFKYGIISQIKEFCFQFRQYFSKTYYPINPYKFGYFLRLWIKYRRKDNLKKAFNKFKGKKDLSEKFVYYALSFEPERTTCPDGNEFHDQIITLIVIRNFLPPEYKIYVKEHPSQFYLAEKGSRGRSPLFYEAIKNIKGVFLLDGEIDSLELIRKAEFTASVSGSGAFESAIMGKKSLVFGDTWYEGCPNITKWNHEITFEEFINKKLSDTEEIFEFIMQQKKLFCIAGCQNPVAQECFRKFLNKNFKNEEIRGVTHIISEFLKSKC